MRRAGVAALVLATTLGVAAAPQSRLPFDSGTRARAANGIDELVFARLKALNIAPANVASDAVFVRRAYLDVIGTLPTAQEARDFIADPAPAKRAALIDRLLDRPEFADYRAMKWSDILRVKSEFPINLWPNAVQAYDRWIRASIRDNVSYDRFVRALLTSSGSNFRVAPVNFYRALSSKDPRTIASAVALTFMGAWTDAWPKDRLATMAAFFSQVGYKYTGEWKEEIVFFDPGKTPDASAGIPGPPKTFPDGTPATVAAGQDPREAFANWLVTPANPWFARAEVNRIWYWLLGRGVIQEPDDIRPDNPPSNPELLAYLEKAFAASKFDVKVVYRLILNSTTYQLSPVMAHRSPAAEQNFACAMLKPLDAEVLIDALNQITGGTEQYQSATPEPFTFIPPEQRSIALSDGSITSSFLETFGRPPRDSGLASERGTTPSAAQRLQLLNGGDVQRKILQGPKMQALLGSGGPAGGQQVLTNLYLTILSRYPTDEEVRAVGAYIQTAGGGPQAAPAVRRQAALDVAWALINSTEFRYRH